MKTSNIFNKSLLLGLFCLPLVFTACSDDDDVDVGESSQIKIVNASEASTPQDFYLNDRKVNSSAIAYEGSEGYISTKSGNDQDAEFRTSGSVTADTEVDLDGNKNYTFFLHGEGTSSAILTSEDDLTAPEEGKAKIRFVHLSSAADQNLDISLLGTKLVSGLSFKNTTSFMSIEDGLHVFQVFSAGTTEDPIELNLASLTEGKIYTVVISGSSNIKATLIANN